MKYHISMKITNTSSESKHGMPLWDWSGSEFVSSALTGHALIHLSRLIEICTNIKGPMRHRREPDWLQS